MKTVPTNHPIEIPDKFRCPICGAKLVLEEIHAWDEQTDGSWSAAGIDVTCTTEPDIEADEWEDWHRGHYRMPYVDWLPLEEKILAWLKANFRFYTDRDMAIAAKYEAAMKQKAGS